MSWTDPAAANSPTVLARTVRGVVSTRCHRPRRGRPRAAAESPYAPRGGEPVRGVTCPASTVSWIGRA